MEKMKVVLEPGAFMPERAHDTDAGADLKTPVAITLAPKMRGFINTKIHVQLPEGTVGLILDKSGLARKKGITILGGVIDEGYSGPLGISILNTNEKETVSFEAGDKVAQLVVIPVLYPEIKRVAAIDSGERGMDGFGSTGR